MNKIFKIIGTVLLASVLAFGTFYAPGKVIVTTAGTKVALSSAATQCATVNIFYPVNKADGTANSGNVYVGDGTLNKTTLIGVGAVLTPGGNYTIQGGSGFVNLNQIYVDADNSGAQVLVSIVAK